jgi:hypothetical protein
MKLCMFWREELSETCRVSCQNKYVKLVHPVGFIIKKVDFVIPLLISYSPAPDLNVPSHKKVKDINHWHCYRISHVLT